MTSTRKTAGPMRLIPRSVLVAAGLGLAVGWSVTACGDSGGTDTETTTTETTETTAETTETNETTQPEQTTENDGTIEIPSPSINIPSPSISVPDLPEVTVSPAP